MDKDFESLILVLERLRSLLAEAEPRWAGCVAATSIGSGTVMGPV